MMKGERITKFGDTYLCKYFVLCKHMDIGSYTLDQEQVSLCKVSNDFKYGQFFKAGLTKQW